jgi:hypothetical protein
MPAPTASEFAVNGFWELLRILILNLCVLLIAGFLCEGGIMGNRKLKFVSAMLGTFGSAFAVLDAAKLYMYVHLYGYTVKRAVAAWCLAMLLIYTLLAIARIFRRFHAFPAAVFVSAVCFAVLCLINVEQCVNAGNIGRYRSGSDAQPDTGVLMECGIDDSLMGLGNTRELVNAGWCEGRAVWDLVPLWKNAVWTDKNGETADFSAAEGSGSYSISTKVHGSVLTLRFENGICTSADITSACGTWRM